MTTPRIRDKRDRIRQLRAFCEALRRGSISRAAEHLGLTQPAVSLHVRELEFELGARLLERTSTGVAPTPAGERCYALAEPLVSAADSLVTDFLRHLELGPSGSVRIAVSNAGMLFVLPPVVARFRDAYPGVAVRLDTEALRDGFQRLLDNEADLLVLPREPYPEETFVYHEICTYRLVLITPPDHPLAGRASVSPREAAAWPAVVPSAGSYSRQFGEHAADAFGTGIDAAVEVAGWGMLKRYVEAGFGLSVVPAFVVLETDRVSVVPLEWEEPQRSFGVFARHDQHLTPTARRFLEVLVPDAHESPPSRGTDGGASGGSRA